MVMEIDGKKRVNLGSFWRYKERDVEFNWMRDREVLRAAPRFPAWAKVNKEATY